MKEQFLQNVAGTIRISVYDKNRPQIPSAATITLYKEDGSTVLQANTAATVNPTTGELTYALTATHTANRGVNFKAVWSYTISGNTYYETQLFDVVRSILSIPITDDDLYKELPSLAKTNLQQNGTATGGSTTTLIDTLKRKEVDDYWVGGIIEIMAGTGAGQTRDITDFAQSTGVVTVDPAFATSPDTTSVYRIIKSFAASIDQSFEKIEQLLYDKGRRPDLILESSQIRLPMIYKTLETIAMDLSDEEGDKWDRVFKHYKEEFEKIWSGLKLDYDEDDSGGVQGQEVQMSTNSLDIFRA